jgi:hypothetical protein
MLTPHFRQLGTTLPMFQRCMLALVSEPMYVKRLNFCSYIGEHFEKKGNGKGAEWQ